MRPSKEAAFAVTTSCIGKVGLAGADPRDETGAHLSFWAATFASTLLAKVLTLGVTATTAVVAVAAQSRWLSFFLAAAALSVAALAFAIARFIAS